MLRFISPKYHRVLQLPKGKRGGKQGLTSEGHNRGKLTQPRDREGEGNYTNKAAAKKGRELGRNRGDLVQNDTKGALLELTRAGPDVQPASYNN